mmetsp:Transcript_26627/g.53054  ORF Transcript_26627/g.53054 Transcript_26627/m.53054 type:complete len:205 (+) Transcript_26627:369-983(+)
MATKKVVRYEIFGSDLFKKETDMSLFVGMKVETESGEVGQIKSTFGTAGKFKVVFPTGTTAREGDKLLLRFRRFANDEKKGMHQDDIILPVAVPGIRIENAGQKEKGKKKKGGGKAPAAPTRSGQISALKGDPMEDGGHAVAIVAGFFSVEENIRNWIGRDVLVLATSEKGSIVGPFGKAGKCKISFEAGVHAPVGSKVRMSDP